MAERNDRRLFADGLIYSCGEWLTALEWIAHKSLDLPADWTEQAIESDRFEAGIKNYLHAARKSKPVEFGEPSEVVEDGLDWDYQPVIGHEPTTINADVREFFEALTPDAEWRISWTTMKKGDRPVSGPMLSRVTKDDRVVFMVAGCDPLIARAAA